MKLKQRLLTGSWLIAALFFFGCENTEPTGAGSSVESELNALALQGSPPPASSAEWGYAKDNGPKNWCDLDPAFTLCCEDRAGASQTPVDIKSKKVKPAKLPKLQFDYAKHTEPTTAAWRLSACSLLPAVSTTSLRRFGTICPNTRASRERCMISI